MPKESAAEGAIGAVFFTGPSAHNPSHETILEELPNSHESKFYTSSCVACPQRTTTLFIIQPSFSLRSVTLTEEDVRPLSDERNSSLLTSPEPDGVVSAAYPNIS